MMEKIPFLKSRAWIELDMAALRHNVAALRALLPSGCELMPAVKANAYGHGAVPVSKELNRLGIGAFCVATAAEGVELRQSGIEGVILILGCTHPKEFPLLCAHHLTQTVVDYAYANCLNGFGRPLHVHVGIDTGMHRLGERCENYDEILAMFSMKNLRIDGVLTHLCAAAVPTKEGAAYTRRQGRAFYDVVGRLRGQGLDCGKTHILNSSGLLNYPELGGKYARVGIALYGALSVPEGNTRCNIDLHPILSLKARVSLVKELYQGEYAGYDLSFRANENTKIAILSIGYADMLPRALSCSVGRVLIHGCAAPIAGQICMDQTLVDVSGIPDVAAGDIAIIIGQAGGKAVSAYDIAAQSGTITNEVLSRIGSRLKRVAI